MILKKICVFVDPISVLNEEDSDLLYNSENYEEAWLDIKRRHNITTNNGSKDIHLFRDTVLKLKSSNPLPDIIPDSIITPSGMIIGVEFKDLKKLNPSITAEDLQEAFVVNCVHFGGGMDEDEEADYIDGYLTFENENYNPSDENSHKNISYEVCWEVKKEEKEEESTENISTEN